MAGDHNHSHASGAQDHRARLWIAFGITAGIVVAQIIGSITTGSLALLTDTAHAASDAAGLLVALIAATLMIKPATAKRTWGFRRIEVIAALGQATLLLVVGIYAAVEGIIRLFNPHEVPAIELLIFGCIGLAANIVAISVLASARTANFNMRAAFLEVINDALGSLGVIIAAIVIALTGFAQADSIAGLFIAALIVPRAIKLMRETTSVLMEFTPHGLDLDQVRAHLLGLEHVTGVHDLHASTVASGLPIISAHIVLEDSCFNDGHAAEILVQVKQCVTTHFEVAIHHSTFQLENQRIYDEELSSGEHSCQSLDAVDAASGT